MSEQEFGTTAADAGRKGAAARAAKLSPERRLEIAKKANAARQAKAAERKAAQQRAEEGK